MNPLIICICVTTKHTIIPQECYAKQSPMPSSAQHEDPTQFKTACSKENDEKVL